MRSDSEDLSVSEKGKEAGPSLGRDEIVTEEEEEEDNPGKSSSEEMKEDEGEDQDEKDTAVEEAKCSMATNHGAESGKTMLGKEMRAIVNVVYERLEHLPPGIHYSENLTQRQLVSDVLGNCITTTVMPCIREAFRLPQYEKFPKDASDDTVKVDLGYDFLENLADKAPFNYDSPTSDYIYNAKADPSIQQYRELFDAHIVYFVDNGRGDFATLKRLKSDAPDHAVAMVLFYPAGVIDGGQPQPILAALDGLADLPKDFDNERGKLPEYGRAARTARESAGASRLREPYTATKVPKREDKVIKPHRDSPAEAFLLGRDTQRRAGAFLDWFTEVAAVLHPNLEIRRPRVVLATICRQSTKTGCGWIAEYNLAAALSAPGTVYEEVERFAEADELSKTERHHEHYLARLFCKDTVDRLGIEVSANSSIARQMNRNFNDACVSILITSALRTLRGAKLDDVAACETASFLDIFDDSQLSLDVELRYWMDHAELAESGGADEVLEWYPRAARINFLSERIPLKSEGLKLAILEEEYLLKQAWKSK